MLTSATEMSKLTTQTCTLLVDFVLVDTTRQKLIHKFMNEITERG